MRDTGNISMASSQFSKILLTRLTLGTQTTAQCRSLRAKDHKAKPQDKRICTWWLRTHFVIARDRKYWLCLRCWWRGGAAPPAGTSDNNLYLLYHFIFSTSFSADICCCGYRSTETLKCYDGGVCNISRGRYLVQFTAPNHNSVFMVNLRRR